ncbi:MAG: NAD(P)/FAD-dependent oxidoreductase [Deltaproteobacteria bacterium]|jgi:all-trans-retinol 13,14-reductase|nr:NAD(P)/FAD-dependent oxidoreductase [Deltaproteobacteria bacterium]
MSEDKTVAVIGGGLAGLTCALILARNGHQVTLVEQSRRLGLTVRGFSREGVYFDTGLHYTGGLAENGIVSRYLRYLGFEPLKLAPFAEDCFDSIYFADINKHVRLPIGFERMSKALKEAFPGEAAGIDAYMRDAREAFADSSLLGFFLDAQGGMKAMLNPKAAISLAAHLDSLTQNPHLKAVLSMHALLYGVSPQEVPFVQHAYVSASYFDSVHNFAGGGGALVEAFERRLALEGVAVITGSAVRRIACGQDKRVAGLELEDGRHIPANACICTAHPSSLAAMAGDIFRPAYLERLRELEDTASAYMFFGIAAAKPSCLRGRNMFLCRGPNLENVFQSLAAPENGPFYVASSPQPANSGKSGIVVVAPGSFDSVAPWAKSSPGKRPRQYKDFKEATVKRVRESLVSLCPELESVRFVDAATPLTMRDYLHARQGGLYGCKHSLAQFNPLPMTRVPNLWLAGQSIIAPGLMGAMISAFLACGFLLGHSTLQRGLACA